ncbi:MAG: zinc ribbon domain-containing protein [Oscillospiraceae bacterium]|nr:zinc ribbon domain-containing protein [Oscillospiraceae bacterium]
MICKNCGAENDDRAFVCVHCGASLNQSGGENHSYNYGQNGENHNYNYGQPGGNYYNYGQNGYDPGYNGQGFNQSAGGSYTYNYNQNYNYEPVQPKFVKKGSTIAALIVAVLTRNIIAIILSVIAIVQCNEFETAVRTGNYPLADQKRSSARTLRIWAWVLNGLSIAFSIAVIVLSFLGMGLGLFDEFMFPFGSELYDEFNEFSQMMINLM